MDGIGGMGGDGKKIKENWKRWDRAQAGEGRLSFFLRRRLPWIPRNAERYRVNRLFSVGRVLSVASYGEIWFRGRSWPTLPLIIWSKVNARRARSGRNDRKQWVTLRDAVTETTVSSGVSSVLPFSSLSAWCFEGSGSGSRRQDGIIQGHFRFKVGEKTERGSEISFSSDVIMPQLPFPPFPSFPSFLASTDQSDAINCEHSWKSRDCQSRSYAQNCRA